LADHARKMGAEVGWVNCVHRNAHLAVSFAPRCPVHFNADAVTNKRAQDGKDGE
jgi:hypothetical protein